MGLHIDFGSDTSPAIFAEKIYVVSDLSTIYCFNADTGEKIWIIFYLILVMKNLILL